MAETWSAGQPELAASALPNAVRDALHELSAAYPEGNVRALSWNERHVAIALNVKVNLPSRGALHDIREVEPILLLCHKQAYPYKAPLVRVDRTDFPAAELPHMNPVGANEPASLCLHRGKMDDWFAEHTIVGLVERAREWLSDAAADLLVRPEDDFEPTRIDASGFFALFDAKSLDERVACLRGEDAGHAFVIHAWISHTRSEPVLRADVLAVRLIGVHPPAEALAAASRAKEAGVLPACGIVAWPSRDAKIGKWFPKLPSNVRELVEFATALGIDLDRALQARYEAGIDLNLVVPVTLVIPRGRKIIGTGIENELLTFAISATKAHAPTGLPWKPDATVFVLGHRRPVTLELAREISSLSRIGPPPRVLLLGAGALGSKLSLHLARRGVKLQTIVDSDTIEPHNLVRHALTGRRTGEPKASALADELNTILPAVEGSATGKHIDAIDYFAKTPREELAFDTVLDATATPNILNLLLHAPIGSARVARAELSDAGALGILMLEGMHRSPRLDDLQARLFDLAVDHDGLAAWLAASRAERDEGFGSRREDIHLGITCNSDTLRLADDVVSYHASHASLRLRAKPAPEGEGEIQLSWTDPTGEDSTRTKVERFRVGAPFVRRAVNDETWQVRMAAGIAEEMQARLQKAAPKETGGILTGFAHTKRRIVYITRLLDAPADSKGTRFGFYRGTKDLPQNVAGVSARTGNLVSYMGEWHTHPKGGAKLSSTDLATKEKLFKENKPEGVPTHLIVVTPTEIAPYVF